MEKSILNGKKCAIITLVILLVSSFYASVKATSYTLSSSSININTAGNHTISGSGSGAVYIYSSTSGAVFNITLSSITLNSASWGSAINVQTDAGKTITVNFIIVGTNYTQGYNHGGIQAIGGTVNVVFTTSSSGTLTSTATYSDSNGFRNNGGTMNPSVDSNVTCTATLAGTATSVSSALTGAFTSKPLVLTLSSGASIPTLSATTAASSITSSTAVSGGNVTADGGASVTARGVCWSTTSNPTISNSKTSDNTGTGTFTSNITGLSAGTLYYVRAYATNSAGTAYGSQVSFTTATIPTLGSTTAASSITSSTAVSGGNVTADGGVTVTARGVCWSTTSNPTISNSKTTDGSGTGTFSSTLTGLSAGTLYYIRSYATNSAGTAYGAQVSFTLTNTDKNISDLPIPQITDIEVASGTKLTTNTAGLTVNSITVQPGAKLDLTNSVTVSSNLTLKADNSSSFSMSVGNGVTVNGTVRYVKTMDHTQWYFISFPCDILISDITDISGNSLGTLGTDFFINYYDGESRILNLGATSNWKSLTDTKLTAYKGYIFGLKDGSGTVDVAFPLSKSIVASETTRTIPVVAYGSGTSVAANHKGWNLVGQPYLSKYAGSNAGVNYMLFPTAANNGQTYDVVYKNNGGRIIDPFTSYFVQVGSNNDISFSLAGRQSAPSAVAVSSADYVQLNLSTATGTDNTSLILDDAQDAAYQIGEDMEKWVGTGTSKPQFYTKIGSINFAYNALPKAQVVNLPLVFYSQSAGNASISVNASQVSNLSKLLLTDKTNGIVTDLLSSTYDFVASAGTTSNRFILNAKGVVSNTNQTIQNDGPLVYSSEGQLIVDKISGTTTILVYDTMGRIINKVLTSNEKQIITLPVGVYNVQLQWGNQTSNCKIINHN